MVINQSEKHAHVIFCEITLNSFGLFLEGVTNATQLILEVSWIYNISQEYIQKYSHTTYWYVKRGKF